jgi:nitroimidazol reductase NimA-like FMN-containing flavoprotein (pyridoxamine 5'-phosphate oxidase superfamily)
MIRSALVRTFAHPHQKLRLGLQEIKKDEVLKAIIDSCSYTILGLSDGVRPYAVPLSFGYKWGKYPIFYLHCATAGRKLDIISQNSKGCLTFVGRATFSPSKTPSPCNAQLEYASVIAEGDIELLRGDEERKEALTAIVRKYGQPGVNFAPDVMKRVIVMKLKATMLAGKAHDEQPQ